MSISTFRLFNGNSLFSSKFSSRYEKVRPQYSSIKIEKIEKVYISENDDFAEIIQEQVEVESFENEVENSGPYLNNSKVKYLKIQMILITKILKTQH